MTPPDQASVDDMARMFGDPPFKSDVKEVRGTFTGFVRKGSPPPTPPAPNR